MTILEALVWAKQLLRKNDVEGPEASAELLLQSVLICDKTVLYASPGIELSAAQIDEYKASIARRAKHEPVWYITGKIDFMGLELAVDKNVLIPRPETELLVEKILESVNSGFAPKSVLEVGTGSGAIVLALASRITNYKLPITKFCASDISREALNVAKANALSLGLGDKIDFQEGDLFEPWNGQHFDLIVANLPYVPDGDKDSLAADLTVYEPHLALFGGTTGLDIIYRFIDELSTHLNPGGKAFLEIGYDQGNPIQDYVANIIRGAKVTVLGDYAGVDRIVIIET